jgi:hypothetical protein
MVVANKEICEKCGNEYWQGCLREDENLICDSCRGYVIKKEVKKLTPEEYKEMIANTVNAKYGKADIKPNLKPSGLQLELEQAVKELKELRNVVSSQKKEIEYLKQQIPLDKHTKYEFLEMVRKEIGIGDIYLGPS